MKTPQIDDVVEVKIRIKVDSLSKSDSGIQVSGYMVGLDGEKAKRGAVYICGVPASSILGEE